MLLSILAVTAIAVDHVSGLGPSKFVLEYSLDGATFTKRADITLRSVGGSQATISQPFDQAHANKVYELSAKGGDYIVRVRRDGDPDDLAVQTFLSACSYYHSGMSDLITIHLDSHDRPQSLQVSSTGKCKATTKKKKIAKFPSKVAIKRGGAGPEPFTDDYVASMRKRQEEGTEAQKGFFQKYWMYIVPIYLVIFLSNSGGEGGGRGGGGGGGGGYGGGDRVFGTNNDGSPDMRCRMNW
eukprot:CAMPEP_0206312158 /NCGR_PEP_ID=MMETSP0106_2-20121207/13843_1 /ASSEMBLY_ACC=CAM_ASM_000206 /TAXON_ID=81532 /ORGANISM="Acanthoeca-like sp., Strain 10tr" /LENGTH=239 /DNA_ID=CAMNT_0053743445 /DNA_START=113 /DNA_END=829 /DNA_ORIENTATION=-